MACCELQRQNGAGRDGKGDFLFEPNENTVCRFSGSFPEPHDVTGPILRWFDGSDSDPPVGIAPAWRSDRLYRMGDGLEDREFLWMMNDLAQKARQQGKLTDEVDWRIEKLNARPAELVHDFVDFTNDMRQIDQVRRELAEVIVELRNIVPQPE
jgi:hypothetical protein